MTNQDIIDTVTSQYNRDLRKKIVKNILQNEKDNDQTALKSSYNITNQIFSYVISQLDWDISSNSNQWDDTPLNIMSQIFPKIETTKWFQNQQLIANSSIELKNNQ